MPETSPRARNGGDRVFCWTISELKGGWAIPASCCSWTPSHEILFKERYLWSATVLSLQQVALDMGASLPDPELREIMTLGKRVDGPYPVLAPQESPCKFTPRVLLQLSNGVATPVESPCSLRLPGYGSPPLSRNAPNHDFGQASGRQPHFDADGTRHANSCYVLYVILLPERYPCFEIVSRL